MTTATRKLTVTEAIELVQGEYERAGLGQSTTESVTVALAPLSSLTAKQVREVAKAARHLIGKTKTQQIASLVAHVAKRSYMIQRCDFAV